MKTITTLGVVAALLAAAGTASATYNTNLGNLAVNDAGISVDLGGGAIPAGLYTSFTVTVDWVAGGGFPWSNEAIWAFTDVPFTTPGAVFYADPGPASNSLASGAPVTLSWTGFFDIPYSGGSSLWFNALQTFGGSNASWNNVDITLGFDTITPPASTFLGTNPNTQISTTLGVNEIQWYSFDLTGGAGSAAWNIDTLESLLSGGSFGDGNDTEIGLYDSAGNVIFTNDDADFGNGVLLSQLTDADGVLADGTYYLAVGGFNTTFGGAFGASSVSNVTGDLVLNVNFIPAPGAVALLGLGGLAAVRRRR